jgi:glyoxylase-like metal-dependent hydrolase (beta-lactamase superfamily II)
MNIVEKRQFGEVEAFRLGYGPIGRPLMSVYLYVLDGLVIDTGQHNMQKAVLDLLGEKKLDRILLTHHHEDHGGNAAAICQQHQIKAWGHPITAQKMADGFKILPYQRFIWGQSERAKLLPVGPAVESNKFTLEAVHTPGHSKDHMVYWEKDNGWLFAGDLYLGPKIKFFRSDENIMEQIESLKKVLKLDFDALFCAHNPCIQDGNSKLRQKLQFLEDIVGQIQNLKAAGVSQRSIFKKLDPGIDRWVRLITMGNVSFANMLKSAYRSEKTG